jgi:hypothetical protein
VVQGWSFPRRFQGIHFQVEVEAAAKRIEAIRQIIIGRFLASSKLFVRNVRQRSRIIEVVPVSLTIQRLLFEGVSSSRM